MKYRCRYCKQKYELIEMLRLNPQVCQSADCRLQYYNEFKDKVHRQGRKKLEQQQRNEFRAMKKKVKQDKKYWRKQADDWFSRYIRIIHRDSIVGGEIYCRCFVRPHLLKRAADMDNGHCFSRSNLLLRFEPDNCRPQNRSGNRYEGNRETTLFMEKLERELGAGRWQRLLDLKRQKGDDTLEYYRAKALHFKEKVTNLHRELNFRKWW